MASFSLSNTKRDLWEKVKKQKQHMKHVDYLSKQNIWKSSMHELAYKSHNKNMSSSIPSGITKTGLSPRWSTPHKKYEQELCIVVATAHFTSGAHVGLKMCLYCLLRFSQIFAKLPTLCPFWRELAVDVYFRLPSHTHTQGSAKRGAALLHYVLAHFWVPFLHIPTAFTKCIHPCLARASDANPESIECIVGTFQWTHEDNAVGE